MSFEPELKKQFQSIDAVAFPIASLRDEYVKFRGLHPRFGQLDEVYQNLRKVEYALFAFLESKKPFLGKKPEGEILMMVEASIRNAGILLDIATSELAFLQGQHSHPRN